MPSDKTCECGGKSELLSFMTEKEANDLSTVELPDAAVFAPRQKASVVAAESEAGGSAVINQYAKTSRARPCYKTCIIAARLIRRCINS